MKGFKIGGFEAHPTKGFRSLSVPRGTNKRRTLIPTGHLALKGCREFNRRAKLDKSGRWPKMSIAERHMMKHRGWS